MKFYFLNLTQHSYDFDKVVFSGTTLLIVYYLQFYIRLGPENPLDKT
jgi:hypothetical protein